MRRLLVSVALLLAVANCYPAPAFAQPVRYDTDYPSAEFHAGRRDALRALLPDTSVAIVFSAPVATRDNDVTYEYRQSSDLYYLTGSHEPTTVLLLAPHGVTVGGETVREILFVPESTDFSEVWLGRRFGTKGAEEILGVERALPASNFESILHLITSSGP
ncbi:MAG TPA: aminopeptidase P N-terminal domain-containing protein, partial [Rhodothermales bacterium]